MSGLRQKAIHSLWWSAAENVGVQILQLIITIILARQLFPEQYGLIAMLAIFMEIAQSLVESGFGSALIQKQHPTQAHYSSVYYFNIFMGIVMAGILCLCAPYIAIFFEQDILIVLTYFMSLNLIIGAFGLVQTNLLTKNLDFKTQSKISLLAVSLSGAIGIVMALNGFGVWSLAVQSVSLTLFRTILLWLFNEWRPSGFIDFVALRDLFGFGSRLLAAGLLDVVFGNLYQLVIGKLFTARDLGFYTQANKLKQVPANSIATIVGRVCYPIFSMIQDDPLLSKYALKKAITFMVLVNFPLMIGMAVCAQPLILVFLTEKWALSIPYLQLLCIVGLLYPLQTINLQVLKATGRSDLFFRLEVIKKVLTVVNIAIGSNWGVIGIIYGQVIGAILSYLLNSYYTGQLLNYNSKEQVQDFLPYLLVSGLMGAIVYVIPKLFQLSSPSLLAIQVVSGIVIYLALCRLLRLDAFMESLDTFSQAKNDWFIKHK